MSYVSGYMSLGDSETIVSYVISKNQSREIYCEFFGKTWFLTALFIWWYVYWIRFSTLKDALIANAISCNFLTLEGYSVISVFFHQSGIFVLNQRNIFVILGEFGCLPGGKFTPRSHPEKFLKTWHFPRSVQESPSEYWDRMSCWDVRMVSKIFNCA